MGADLSDSIPVAQEDVDRIMARMVADAVAGVDPTDRAYPDVIPGAVLHDLFGAVSLEADRIYDRAHTEVVMAAMPTTATGEWLDEWAAALGVERNDESYASGTIEFTVNPDPNVPAVPINDGVEVSTVAVSEDDDEVSFQVTTGGVIPAGGGTIELPVTATDPGAIGNVAANTVTLVQSNVPNLSSATNPDPMRGGADVESDESLQAKNGQRLGGGIGPGNAAWYVARGLEEPGVGHVTVQPNWDGHADHVRLMLTDEDNRPVGPATVSDLQAALDPADGYGEAPPGATVTVAAPALVGVDVTAAITYAPGYSEDGAGGTIALGDALRSAVEAYVNKRGAGEDPIRHRIMAALIDVGEGVIDADVTVPAGDVAIADDQVAFLNSLTLT